jgi:protein gp37
MKVTFRAHPRACGGESGPGARPMDPAWGDRNPRPVPRCARAVLLQAMGWNEKGESARELEGRTWNEMPTLALPIALV